MKKSLFVLIFCFVLVLPRDGAARVGVFIVKPYLQIGTDPAPTRLSLVWMTPDDRASWDVAYRTADGPLLHADVHGRRVTVRDVPYRTFVAVFDALQPDHAFRYDVTRNARKVFGATATAPPDGPVYHAVLFGDCGDGSGSERAIAHAAFAMHPDLALIPGDIVYPYGTWQDYLRNFFPDYNADHVLAGGAVPFMRSVPFVAAPGNHDVPASTKKPLNFSRLQDALAYYYLWLQPLNGPLADSTRPPLRGSAHFMHQFLDAAGPTFPRMGSFSFNWGKTHWLILDSNRYVNWSDAGLRRWVADDLAGAQGASWRFVMFHHAPFHSSLPQFRDEWMRVLEDVFERGRVDVVFAGHVHDYQRTWPLHFRPRPQSDGQMVTRFGTVEGDMRLDKAFDGVRDTDPDGIVHIVSGGGGAPLYGPNLPPRRWKPYTCRLAPEWSFTDINVADRRLLVRQLRIDGTELDRFAIVKR